MIDNTLCTGDKKIYISKKMLFKFTFRWSSNKNIEIRKSTQFPHIFLKNIHNIHYRTYNKQKN